MDTTDELDGLSEELATVLRRCVVAGVDCQRAEGMVTPAFSARSDQDQRRLMRVGLSFLRTSGHPLFPPKPTPTAGEAIALRNLAANGSPMVARLATDIDIAIADAHAAGKAETAGTLDKVREFAKEWRFALRTTENFNTFIDRWDGTPLVALEKILAP